MAAVGTRAGQTVTAGQVLATQDTATLDANLIQAQATLSSAEARLSLDRGCLTAIGTKARSGDVAGSAAEVVEEADPAVRDTIH